MQSTSHTATNAIVPLRERRAIRLARLIDKTGLSRTHIYRLIKAGKFPPPIKLSEAVSAWDEAVIDSWLESKFSGGVGEEPVSQLSQSRSP